MCSLSLLQISDPDNPLPPTNVVVTEENGQEYADAQQYLGGLQTWAANLEGLPSNDEIMVFTMYVTFNANFGQISSFGFLFEVTFQFLQSIYL